MINLAPRFLSSTYIFFFKKIVKTGTKFNFDQITQFWPNYTILTKFHNFDQITQFRPNITNLIWAMYVRLHIHLLWYNLGGIFSGGVVVYILKEKDLFLSFFKKGNTLTVKSGGCMFNWLYWLIKICRYNMPLFVCGRSNSTGRFFVIHFALSNHEDFFRFSDFPALMCPALTLRLKPNWTLF